MEVNQRFTSAKFYHSYKAKDNANELLFDPTCYQKLVGKLLHLTMTLPDISYTIQNLSKFMYRPKRSHMEGARRVVKYLKDAPGLGILLSSKPSSQLTVYCDADWATCPMTKRPVCGFIVKLGDSLSS
ncbi:putative mitochondrial protein AtMg00240 [Nicotiana tabacum]|uniref:Mitochondrial protein AtMg00240 n=1 Tax=Nicotiana tabacum TaxID=4097 RepID=A0A1S3ZKL6_TOBAC